MNQRECKCTLEDDHLCEKLRIGHVNLVSTDLASTLAELISREEFLFILESTIGRFCRICCGKREMIRIRAHSQFVSISREAIDRSCEGCRFMMTGNKLLKEAIPYV